MTIDKSHEAKLRRKALRNGLRLVKARPSTDSSRGYSLIEEANSWLIFGQTQGEPFGASVEQIEKFLQRASTP